MQRAVTMVFQDDEVMMRRVSTVSSRRDVVCSVETMYVVVPHVWQLCRERGRMGGGRGEGRRERGEKEEGRREGMHFTFACV